MKKLILGVALVCILGCAGPRYDLFRDGPSQAQPFSENQEKERLEGALWFLFDLATLNPFALYPYFSK